MSWATGGSTTVGRSGRAARSRGRSTATAIVSNTRLAAAPLFCSVVFSLPTRRSDSPIIARQVITSRNWSTLSSLVTRTRYVAQRTTQQTTTSVSSSTIGELIASIRLIFSCSPTRSDMIRPYRRRSNRSALAPLTTRMPVSVPSIWPSMDELRWRARRLARRIFFPNFWITPTITGAKRTMNSVSFQLTKTATPNANSALTGIWMLWPRTLVNPSCRFWQSCTSLLVTSLVPLALKNETGTCRTWS